MDPNVLLKEFSTNCNTTLCLAVKVSGFRSSPDGSKMDSISVENYTNMVDLAFAIARARQVLNQIEANADVQFQKNNQAEPGMFIGAVRKAAASYADDTEDCEDVD